MKLFGNKQREKDSDPLIVLPVVRPHGIGKDGYIHAINALLHRIILVLALRENRVMHSIVTNIVAVPGPLAWAGYNEKEGRVKMTE